MAGPRGATVLRALAAPSSGSPVVASGNVVWIGTSTGDVVASVDGVTRATFATGAPVLGSAAIDADGTAIIGGGDGTLYGLAAPPPRDADAGDGGDGGDGDADAGDGGVPPARVVFSRTLGPMRGSPVIGADGTIYVPTAGQLVALAPRAASVRWSVPTNDTAGASAAIGQDGTIYLGSSDHRLLAFAPDGSARWALDLGSAVGSPIVGGDGRVYAGTLDGKLHAIGPAGTQQWSYTTGGAITSAPAVHAGVVYVGSADRKLHAISTSDGSPRWVYETQGVVASPVIGSDGLVYVGATDARVYAITPAGSLFFAVNLRGKVTSTPAFGGGQRLWVTTDTGLAAIGP